MPPSSIRKESLINKYFDNIHGDSQKLQCKNCDSKITGIVHSLEKHLQTQHKELHSLYKKASDGKTKKRLKRDSSDSESEESVKRIKTEPENSLAEVFIKSYPSSSNGSSESESESESSRSEIRYSRKKRRSKKKTREGSKKMLRKLKNQIDLFQRNVDIKLNYLESLMQTLIKNQNNGATTNESNPKQLRLKKSTEARRMRVYSPVSEQLPSSSHLTEEMKQPTEHVEVPYFPISDADTLYDWNQKLKNAEYRLSVSSILIAHASFLEPTNFRRVKALMYYMFDTELLSTFSWTGLGHKYISGISKKAFKGFTGIMALVKVTLNNSSRVEDQLNETDLVACLRDALKRAALKVKRTSNKSGKAQTSKSKNFEDDQDEFSAESESIQEAIH